MGKLEKYHQKRDFGQTAEPKGKLDKKKSTKLKFVVQRHDARRLHYDFRLELDGVLKSWAVPKGPSLNPKDKRLAVMVEDHPIDYQKFEGIIPKGNYGAGHVQIVDSGYYEFLTAVDEEQFLHELQEGSIKFKLQGHLLKGEFALVRMKQDAENQWLLIKHQDKYAVDRAYDMEDEIRVKPNKKNVKNESLTSINLESKDEKLYGQLQEKGPMLCKSSTELPVEADWIFEKKYDGYRIVAIKEAQKIQLLSRNGKDMNKQFPSLVKELKTWEHEFIFDGELVIEDSHEKSHFQLLQSGEPTQNNLSLIFYVFDLLSLDGVDLRSYSLIERKDVLNLLINKHSDAALVRRVELLKGTRETIQAHAENQGWEGVIAKEKDSTYHLGRRSGSWLKVKFKQSQEAIICGYTKGEGSRKGFGALLLGIYEFGQLTYIGNCGTGFSDSFLKDLSKKLKQISTDINPFSDDEQIPKRSQVTWVEPKMVCEVYFSEWTKDLKLRHPVFKGLRVDKEPEEITKEELLDDEEVGIIKKDGFEISLTNLDKLYWPVEKITKGQMIQYYDRIANYILPYLKDRPISMHRFPNGIEQKSFFQKDVEPSNIPQWVKTSSIYAESTGKHIDYLLINNEASLLYVANLGSIEINPWLSTIQQLENPDFAVLDLDPNGADFKEVVAVALSAKQLFEKIGVKPFIKTSGSTGLHIFIYVDGKYPYELVRDFVQLIAEIIHEQHPETTSLIRDPKKRKGLIYLDYLQNKKGQTIVAPYAVRPKPAATVSAPLQWKEVTAKLKISDYHIFNMPMRLKELGDIWKDMWKHPANLKKAISKL